MVISHSNTVISRDGIWQIQPCRRFQIYTFSCNLHDATVLLLKLRAFLVVVPLSACTLLSANSPCIFLAEGAKLTLFAKCLAVRRSLVNVLPKRLIQGNRANNFARLQPNPRLEFAVDQIVLVHKQLPRAPLPVTATTIPCALAVADVQALAGGLDGVVRHRLVRPLVAPRVSMLMGRKDTHETGCRRQCLHEGHILPAPGTGAVLDAVGAVAFSLAGLKVVVDAGVAIRVNPWTGLNGVERIRWDVDEREGGDGLSEFSRDALVLGGEPRCYAGIDPVLAIDLLPIDEGIVLESTAAVKEPQDKFWRAAASAGA